MPSRIPSASAPKISRTGRKMAHARLAAPPLIDCAAAMQTENRTSAIASSSATTESSVFVTGPLALYWLMTIMVDAGAVAAAIDPRTRENGTEYPVRIIIPATNTTANKDSRQAMMTGAVPTCRKYDRLNSLPIENAMNPRAASGMIVILLMNDSDSTENGIPSAGRKYGPSRSPAIRYPVTFGSLRCFISLPINMPDRTIMPRLARTFKSGVMIPLP